MTLIPPRSPEEKVSRLVPEVDAALREELQDIARTLASADNPKGVLLHMSRLGLMLMERVLDWSTSNSPEIALRLGGALWFFWYVKGHLTEGRQRLAAILDRAGPLKRSVAGGRLLSGAGTLALAQGDSASARAYHQEGLEIYTELGDRRGLPSAWAISAV